MRARALIALYPLGWRRRYATEMAALLEDSGVGTREALDLLVGAAAAHLRPRRSWSALVAPGERMRNTVGAVALCWGALCLAGAGFAKATEDLPFRSAGHAHPLLGALHAAVAIVAFVSAGVVAVAGAPLLGSVLVVAWRQRRRDLAGLLAAPPLALALYATATVALLRLGADSRPVALAWLTLGVATAAVWAGAPRLVLARVDASESLLRLAARGAVVLSAAMVAISALIAAYAVSLRVSAPATAALSNGPLAATNTTELLGLCAAVAAVAAALATVSAARGARASYRIARG